MTAVEIPTPDPRTFDDTARPFAEAISAHYAVKRQIGRGGMGVVFLARDRRLDRLVAIKTLPPQLANDPSVRERFLRETRTAGGMTHPNIVPIHGADEIEGHVFFVMSYIDGESLASYTRAHGRLDPRVVGPYLRDVASALAHAHRRGIIHRDIKAENILIERATDRALVTDFGIARLAEATPLTATGQVLGTVYYVSPEQVSGEPVDARSDIYSLGVVGFFALTGRFPFEADVASAVLVAHVTKAAPAVASINPDVPPALAQIVDRCLSKDRAQRYATADDLLAAIEATLPGLARTGGTMVSKTLISDTEAHAVWRRASELQAATGLQPRPEPIARPRDTVRDRTRKTGFAVDDVRAAGSEAGISDSYIEHALVEHGLVQGRTAPPAPPVQAAPATPPKRSIWAGVPLGMESEIVVDGEIPARDLDLLLTVLRDETGRLGTTHARTREIGWITGGIGNRLEVSVIPAQGRTTIRLTRKFSRAAIVTMLTTATVVSFTVGPAIAVLLIESGAEEEIGVLLAMAVGAATALFGGRRILRRLHARATERLRRLGEA
ncbi:MAG TPA: serine/threonine-protein kinase, partial [Gemmatimonadaceae bacterium]